MLFKKERQSIIRPKKENDAKNKVFNHILFKVFVMKKLIFGFGLFSFKMEVMHPRDWKS